MTANPTPPSKDTTFGSELVDRIMADGSVLRLAGGEIHLPRVFGFCRGVRRALTLLEQAVQQHSGGRLFLLGQIIHNPWVNEHFKQRGVKLLFGVDSGFRYQLPGFSIHDELRLRVEAGLTPYQALRMGTANVAEFLQSPDHAGTVSVGKRADLILLQANPLNDVGNVSRRMGVMVGGLWLSEEWLRERLEEIARSYGN